MDNVKKSPAASGVLNKFILLLLPHYLHTSGHPVQLAFKMEREKRKKPIIIFDGDGISSFF